MCWAFIMCPNHWLLWHSSLACQVGLLWLGYSNPWGISSAGRVPASHAGSQRFDSAILHHFSLLGGVQNSSMHTPLAHPPMKTLTPREYAEKVGVKRTTVLRWCHAGKLNCKDFIDEHGQKRWEIYVEDEGSDFDQIVERWVEESLAGVHKKRAYSPNTIRTYIERLVQFWKETGLKPSVEHIGAEGFICYLKNVPDNRQVNSYSRRSNTHKALCLLMHSLILHGLKTEKDLKDLEALGPKKTRKPIKHVVPHNEFKDLVEWNDHISKGNTPYDRKLTKLILYMFAYTGLRRQDLADLLFQDVTPESITVREGKGMKDRVIGLIQEVKDVLIEYLEVRPNVRGPLLVQENGKQMTGQLIYQRLYRLSKASGIKVHPHALRRSFATYMSAEHMPIGLISLALGHNDLRTTQGYLMHSEKELIDWMNKKR